MSEEFTKVRAMVFPRTTVLGHGVISQTADVCRTLLFGHEGLIVTGDNTYQAAGKAIADQCTDAGYDMSAVFVGNTTQESVDKVMEAVKKSDEIGSGATRGTYDAVCNFISSEFAYDFVRAATISPGELPDIDYCYENRMGICQDLSAVMVCMLRVQGIPARLVIGYADKYYHAWTVTVLDGEEIFFDPTVAVGALNVNKYAIERMY